MSTTREVNTQLVIPFSSARMPSVQEARRETEADANFSPALFNFGITALLLVAFVAVSGIALVIGRVFDPTDHVSLGVVLATIGGGLVAASIAINTVRALLDRYEGDSVTNEATH